MGGLSVGGGGYKSLGGMDPDTFAPSDVIHLFVMEIDLDLSLGDPGGVAARDDDEVGKFSDEELVDLPEGDIGNPSAGTSCAMLVCSKRGVISPSVARISRGVGYKWGGL